MERLPFLLRRSAVALDQLVSQVLARSGLEDVSATGVHVLALVRRGRPASAVADALRISPQATGRVVARLEQQGWCRYPHIFDGRAMMVDDGGGGSGGQCRPRGGGGGLHVIGDDLEPQRLTALVRDIEDLAEVGEARHPWACR